MATMVNACLPGLAYLKRFSSLTTNSNAAAVDAASPTASLKVTPPRLEVDFNAQTPLGGPAAVGPQTATPCGRGLNFAPKTVERRAANKFWDEFNQ